MGSFGKILEEKRKKLGLTLMEAAKKLDISFSYLSDMEKGRKLPPNSTKESHRDLLRKIKEEYQMTDTEYEELLKTSDQELIDKGHISNDISEYMSDNPLATIALRKAVNKSLSENDWKDIIRKIEGRNNEENI